MPAWFIGVALNVARNHVARRVRERAVVVKSADMDAAALDVPVENACPLQQAANNEMLERVALALPLLTKELRETFALACLEQLSYEEVASHLAVPVGTVRSRVNKARSLLRSRVEGRQPAQEQVPTDAARELA